MRPFLSLIVSFLAQAMALSDNDVTPVFGLSKAQLQPIVENIAGGPVTSFDVSIQHEVRGHYGIMGDKLIPTFLYASRQGATGQRARSSSRGSVSIGWGIQRPTSTCISCGTKLRSPGCTAY